MPTTTPPILKPDQRREDEGQRAAGAARRRPRRDRHSVDGARDGRARAHTGRPDAGRQETRPGWRRGSKGFHRQARPRAGAKSSLSQVSNTPAQHAVPRRTCRRPGHRQNPTGIIRSMSKRSPEPCRHGGTAPYPRGTDPGARRQTLCDTDRNGAGTRDSLTRDHRSATARYFLVQTAFPRLIYEFWKGYRTGADTAT
jgi:hypothetical protein